MRSCFDQAWNALPFETRTLANRDTIAAAIVRLAARGERDPARLSEYALKAIIPRNVLVEHYNFEVVEGDEVIASLQSIELPHAEALWSRVAELAKRIYAPGRTIRVTNQLGEMVIMIGVAAANRAVTSFAAQ